MGTTDLGDVRNAADEQRLSKVLLGRKVIEIDRMNRMNLSYIDAVDPDGATAESRPPRRDYEGGDDRPPRRDHGGGRSGRPPRGRSGSRPPRRR